MHTSLLVITERRTCNVFLSFFIPYVLMGSRCYWHVDGELLVCRVNSVLLKENYRNIFLFIPVVLLQAQAYCLK